MRSTNRLWVWAALVAALIAFGGCGSSSSSKGNSDSSTTTTTPTVTCVNTGNGVDTIGFNGTTYTEGQSGLASSAAGVTDLCDPLLDAFTFGSPGFEIYFYRQITGAAIAVDELFLDFDGAATGTYTVASVTADIQYLSNTEASNCFASAGTISITAFGADGGLVTGTYSVPGSSWTQYGTGTCPSSTFSGAFSVTRNETNAFGIH